MVSVAGHTDHANVGGALAGVVRRLAAAGVDSARLDARLLMAAATGESAAAVIARPERPLSRREAERLETMVARRRARVPVAQILGVREFWSLEFGVNPAVLTPRPDSETVIEAVGDHLAAAGDGMRLLDLGTGSGCLLLALLHEYPAASGCGIDISEAAVGSARANAARLGLGRRARFLVGDWTDPLAGRFEAIVCNPPYIPSAAIDDLEPEVARHEPRHALDGGPDGLDAYRELLPALPALLAPGGIIAFETGAGQNDAVCALARASGLVVAEQRPDITGVLRVAILRQPNH